MLNSATICDLLYNLALASILASVTMLATDLSVAHWSDRLTGSGAWARHTHQLISDCNSARWLGMTGSPIGKQRGESDGFKCVELITQASTEYRVWKTAKLRCFMSMIVICGKILHLIRNATSVMMGQELFGWPFASASLWARVEMEGDIPMQLQELGVVLVLFDSFSSCCCY